MRRGRRRSRGWIYALGILAALGLVGAAWYRTPPAAPADRLVTPAPAVPGTPMTLAVFGTSLTARSKWPEAVAEGLGRCLDRPVRLVRVAEPGALSSWGVGRVADVVAASPDLVLLEFAINDADLRDGLSLAESEANHRAMIAALQAALPEARVVLLTMNPAQGARGLMRPFLPRYYAAYGPIAAETGSGLIDLNARWLSLPRDRRGLADDGLHPDEAAVQAVVVPAVIDQLGLMSGRDCAAAGAPAP